MSVRPDPYHPRHVLRNIAHKDRPESYFVSYIMTKQVFGDSDQVGHKLACTVTEEKKPQTQF